MYRCIVWAAKRRISRFGHESPTMRGQEAAPGLQLARLGKRTLVMSIDPAHSLADAFDLDGALFHNRTAEPLKVAILLLLPGINIRHGGTASRTEFVPKAAMIRKQDALDYHSVSATIIPITIPYGSAKTRRTPAKNGAFRSCRAVPRALWSVFKRSFQSPPTTVLAVRKEASS
jgi:hypothetical protein